METVVLLIMFMVCLSYLLKLSFMRPWLLIAESAVAAIFTLWALDWAIGQSKTQISDWLGNPELMLDTSVLLTIDVALQIAFCIVHAAAQRTKAGRILSLVLLVVPGILIFPVLAAALTELIFSLPGTDFDTVGRSMAAAVLVLAPILSYGLKYLLPDSEQRLELVFYINCIIAMLGIVATVNGRTAVAGVSELNLPALGAMAGIAIVTAAIGLILFNRKLKKQS